MITTMFRNRLMFKVSDNPKNEFESLLKKFLLSYYFDYCVYKNNELIMYEVNKNKPFRIIDISKNTKARKDWQYLQNKYKGTSL